MTAYRAVALSACHRSGVATLGGTDLTALMGSLRRYWLATSRFSYPIRPVWRDQAIVGDRVGVKVDLDFGVQGNYLQGGDQVFDEEFASFVQVLDIGVAAVPVICERIQ